MMQQGQGLEGLGGEGKRGRAEASTLPETPGDGTRDAAGPTASLGSGGAVLELAPAQRQVLQSGASTAPGAANGEWMHSAAAPLSIPFPLPHTPAASTASPVTLLMAEGGALLEQLPASSGHSLLDAVARGQSPAASAVRSRLNTPGGASGGLADTPVWEDGAPRERPLDRLIVEADELAQRLPDEHVVELLAAIERGSTPVARAVRSRTPLVLRREGQDGSVSAEGPPVVVPILDLDRAKLADTAQAVVAVLTERTRRAVGMLEEQGKLFMDQLDHDSRADIATTLASLSHTSPVASLLVSALLHSGLLEDNPAWASDPSNHCNETLQNLIEDASLVLAAIEAASKSGSGVEERSSVLSTLQEMAGCEGQDSFVARMLYLDLVTSCRSVAEGGNVDGSMSARSQEQFRELLTHSKQMIWSLEEHHTQSVIDAISGGVAASSPLASVLYLHLLLGVEIDDQTGMRSALRNIIVQCRNALRHLFGELVPVDDGASSSATSSRPNSRAAPRRRFRDTRSPRTKAGEECVNSAIETVIVEIVRQEVAELCHHNLRALITEWSGKLNQSKQGVKELQELISGEERANAHRHEELPQEEEVDESSSAPSDTYYTFKLCEQGDVSLVVGSVRLAADTKWAEFQEAVAEQLGYSISSIRYDDDFGPKQAKDIFCTNKSEWKELRDMMEEDKEEIQDVLTVEVFKLVGGYRVKLETCEEGAPVDLEDLREMLSTCSTELQAAQKVVLECQRRLKASWKYHSSTEYECLERLQGVFRAACIRRRFCKAREKVLYALHIFRPPILRYWQSLHFKNRHAISSIKLQSAFRGRKARKLAYIATVEAVATSTLMDVAMGMIYSVSEEERAIHKEWVIVDATNAARDFQRFVRLKLSPSRETIIAQFELEDGASYFIVRFFRAIQRRKRFFRSAIAAVTTENVLFGPAMERAFKELLKDGKAQHMQAVFRRIAVQEAFSGHVTSASDELAITWAIQDLVLWVLESQDEMYEEPRRIHAATWHQGFVRRCAARESFCLLYRTALMFQTTSRRYWHQLEWRKEYDAIKTLSASLVRQKHRNWHCKLYYTACKTQDRSRAMRLVYATRRFKRLVDHLIDVARSNLYRRFYTHVLLVAGRQTSVLQFTAASADYTRKQEAARKRDERRKEEAQRLAAEANKKRGARRGTENVSTESASITRLSSVEKLKKIHQEGERVRKISENPSEMIFAYSPGAVMETAFDVINAFVSLQPKSAGNSSEKIEAKEKIEAIEEHQADLAEKLPDQTDGAANANCAKGAQEQVSSEWFKTSDCCQTLGQFCDTQLKEIKKDQASSLYQHFLFWLQNHFESVANSWQNCDCDAFLVLEVANSLLTAWAGRCWIRNPGFMALEVDDLKQTFDAFMMLFKDVLTGFEKLRKEFPNIAVAPALLQSLQDSCAKAQKSIKDQNTTLRRHSKLKSIEEEEAEDAEAKLMIRLTLIMRWLNEDQDSLFRRVDQSFDENAASAFWAGVFVDLMKYCYRNDHIKEVPPLSIEELMVNIQQYSTEFDSDYDAIETPFQTFDGLWTLIFAGQEDYMDTTREFTWTPEGYALNSSSGKLVPVEAPDTSNVKSIYSVVHSLSWEFEKQMAAKLLPGMRHIHPVGFLGALSARRRRDRVHMWTALAIETTVCKFLNYAIRIAQGHALITVLRVFTILCLRPGRGTLLFQAGCVELLNTQIVGCESTEEVELSSAAAFALQSLLSDVYVASQVKTTTVLDIAGQLKHPVHGTMHVSIVYCLQLIIRNNESCKMELAHQTWLHGILLKLIRMKDGPEGLVASVAMLIAMLSYDAEVARLFGKDPETIFELILMLRDATDIVSRQSSLTALSSLGLSPENIEIMIQHHAFHDTLMGILATQSLQLFPLSASLAVRFVKNARMCNATMQYPKVLNALLHSMTFSDVRISAPATEVLMALTSSIEKAWLLVNSSKQPELKDLQNLVVAAGQVEQFGVNSFAMSTICHAMVSAQPISQPYAARAFRSILRCSITACDWVLRNEDAMQILVDGVRHRDETVQESCIWSIHDLSARNKGAAALVKRGGFVRLKVLLYTDAAPMLQVGVIRSLKHFLLGLHRVAGPDEELIRRITELLNSDNESVQDACADMLSKMIQQDYIDLMVNVHAASNCPQSDNWGYCDPFVKMMINGQEHQTPILRNTLNPVWDFSCQFSISDKSDILKVELYDWDNTGPEVLGEIPELSCERLHELGTELGLYSVGRMLTEKVTTLRNGAEQKASTTLDEARAKASEIKHNAEEEATKLRDELLEEARFIGSDSKAEAKLILDTAAAKGKALIDAAAGQSRQMEFRAEQQAEKLKEAAKKQAAHVEKVWQDTVQDIEDIEERIKQLKKQAKSKYDRIRKEASEEADKMLYHAMKESQKIMISSSEEAERILSLKEGWHIVMEKDRDELTGQELMGPKGDIEGFDDNGKVVGAGGKPLQVAPTVIKINFEYNINVNVDEIIFDQSWIVGRLFELLALENRQVLRENILVIMRALTEDVKESRLAFGQYPGGLQLLSEILATPGLDSCYVEICKLLWQLLYEPDNRMPIYRNSLMMGHLNNMRTLHRWRGSLVASIAKDSIAKLEKHADRVRKMEKQQKKEARQLEAANRLKKINAAASPKSNSPRSPNTISPEQSQESLVGSQLSQGSLSSSEPAQAGKHQRRSRKRVQGSLNTSDIVLESELKEPGPVPVFEGPKVEPDLDEVDLYADPDYAADKEAN